MMEIIISYISITGPDVHAKTELASSNDFNEVSKSFIYKQREERKLAENLMNS